MKLQSISRRAWDLGLNSVSRGIFAFTGLARPLPKRVFFEISTRCNLKCRHCDYWELPPVKDALGKDDWLELLEEVRARTGTFTLIFRSAEPLLEKETLFSVARAAARAGVRTICTTNGVLFDEEAAGEFCSSRFTWLQFSLESLDAATREHLRGEGPGPEVILSAVRALRRRGKAPLVNLAVVVLKQNTGELGRIARWAADNGLDGVNFHPLQPRGSRWRELLPGPTEAAAALDEVARLKSLGCPVRNTYGHLEKMKAYFSDPFGDSAPGFCLSAVTARILQNGDMLICPHEPPVGNVREGGFWRVWNSPAAAAGAARAARCRKFCAVNCDNYHPGAFDRLRAFFKESAAPG